MNIGISEWLRLAAATSLVIVVTFLAYFHATTGNVRTVAARLAGPEASLDRYIGEAQLIQYQRVVASSQTLSVRQLDPADTTLHERHKLRWLYKALETTFYRAAYGIGGPKAGLYARMFHFAVVTGIVFLFVALAMRHYWGALPPKPLFIAAVGFIAFLLFVSFGTISEDFTPQETASIAAGLFFALRRRLLLFSLAVIVATINRESGLAVGLLWPILNGPSLFAFLPIAVAAAILLGINYDLLSQAAFWAPTTYVSLAEFHRPGVFNFYKFPATLIVGAVAEILVVLSPLVFCFAGARADPASIRLFLCIGLYLAVLLFGTFIGNVFPYLMLVPFIMVLWARRTPLKDPV